MDKHMCEPLTELALIIGDQLLILCRMDDFLDILSDVERYVKNKNMKKRIKELRGKLEEIGNLARQIKPWLLEFRSALINKSYDETKRHSVDITIFDLIRYLLTTIAHIAETITPLLEAAKSVAQYRDHSALLTKRVTMFKRIKKRVQDTLKLMRKW